MVDDLQAVLKRIDQTEAECAWPIYVNQIRFHIEVFKYDRRFSLFY